MAEASKVRGENKEVDLNAFNFAFGKFLRRRDTLPLYEFICLKCGNKQEIACRVGGEEYKHMPCNVCGVSLWQRVPSAPAVHFSEEFLKNR